MLRTPGHYLSLPDCTIGLHLQYSWHALRFTACPAATPCLPLHVHTTPPPPPNNAPTKTPHPSLHHAPPIAAGPTTTTTTTTTQLIRPLWLPWPGTTTGPTSQPALPQAQSSGAALLIHISHMWGTRPLHSHMCGSDICCVCQVGHSSVLLNRHFSQVAPVWCLTPRERGLEIWCYDAEADEAVFLHCCVRIWRSTSGDLQHYTRHTAHSAHPSCTCREGFIVQTCRDVVAPPPRPLSVPAR